MYICQDTVIYISGFSLNLPSAKVINKTLKIYINIKNKLKWVFKK